MLYKIIQRSERFSQEILSIFIYILYQITIHKLLLRRFDKARFFRTKRAFLPILPSKICKLFIFAFSGVYWYKILYNFPNFLLRITAKQAAILKKRPQPAGEDYRFFGREI